MEMKNGSSMRLTPAQSGFRLLDTTFYRFPLKVYAPFFGGHFSVNSLPRQGSGLPKKAPPPTGMVELS
jgi:hypothetical protein